MLTAGNTDLRLKIYDPFAFNVSLSGNHVTCIDLAAKRAIVERVAVLRTGGRYNRFAGFVITLDNDLCGNVHNDHVLVIRILELKIDHKIGGNLLQRTEIEGDHRTANGGRSGKRKHTLLCIILKGDQRSVFEGGTPLVPHQLKRGFIQLKADRTGFYNDILRKDEIDRYVLSRLDAFGGYLGNRLRLLLCRCNNGQAKRDQDHAQKACKNSFHCFLPP